MHVQQCPVVVGRDAELELLDRSLSSAAAGTGCCVMVLGEAGIGKSRLVREARIRSAGLGLAVATGRASPGSASSALQPVADALMRLLREHPLADESGLGPWLGALRPVLGVPAGQRMAHNEFTASLRAEALLEAVRRVAPGGAMIVLEDLHWADADTVSLVEYLADSIEAERLALVVTMRSKPATLASGLARRTRATAGVVQLHLGRLDEGHAATMASACRPGATTEELQRVAAAAEGIPLLVEELLASSGVPESFAGTVRARLAELDGTERRVIEAAAVLGRVFDWRLLAAVTGQPDGAVERAFASAVASLLLTNEGGLLRFRHALTREAVLDTVLPPAQRAVAASALDALVASRPVFDPADRALAIDLAERAGDRRRAGMWLLEAGRQAIAWGALASAADAFGRSAGMLAGQPEQTSAEREHIGALSLSGRVEEAAAAGGRLLSRLSDDPDLADERLRVHIDLARAAVAASRWQMAQYHLDAAGQLAGPEPLPGIGPQLAVLRADVCMAGDDYDAARGLAEGAARDDDSPADVRCHAFEIIGRGHRSADLEGARRAFGQALVTAEAAGLPLWRLRALHELGTVDLYDHAGVDRLLEARRLAQEAGALSTAAVLDLQLSAAHSSRWDLDACDDHARAAIAIAERLGLDHVRAKALGMLAGSASMRADRTATEHYAALTMAADPGDRMLEGFLWGMRGMALLLSGDTDASIEPYGRGIAVLARLPRAEPAALRALWPLVLASRSDRRAQGAVDDARRLGVGGFALNRALLGYAEALLAAGRGDARRAGDLVAESDPAFANCEGWADLARLLAAPAALAGDWADASAWLAQASVRFVERRLPALASRAKQLLGSPQNPWSELGVTDREAGVLAFVRAGLTNKEIATELHLSPRTVEKHVEALLRKTGSRSRTQLVAQLAASPAQQGPPPTT